MELQRMSRLLAVAAGAMIFSAVASAQAKVAIINLNQAVAETAEIKKAQAELEAKYKPRREQGEKLSRDAQGIQQQLEAGRGKLTGQAEQDLSMQLQRKQRELQRLGEDLNAEVEVDRTEVLGRTSQRMQEVVKKLAEEKGLDVVIDATDTVFYKPALDISKEATAAYDKAYPVK